MGKMTEEDRLMRRINQRFMKGVMNYRLIEEGDRILVGLSGGKDSLALLELLARLEAMNPEARYSLWGSMSNIQSDMLPVEEDSPLG